MRALIVTAGLSFALALVACGGTSTSTATLPGRALTVETRDLAFDLSEVVVMRDEPVRLILRNRGALPHDFTVDEMPVRGVETRGSDTSGGHAAHGPAAVLHLAVAPGRSAEIAFTAAEPGTYEYYCSEPGHREAGMIGVLRVE